MLRRMLSSFGKLAMGASRSRGAIPQLLHPCTMESQLESARTRSETVELPHTFGFRGCPVSITVRHLFVTHQSILKAAREWGYAAPEFSAGKKTHGTVGRVVGGGNPTTRRALCAALQSIVQAQREFRCGHLSAVPARVGVLTQRKAAPQAI